MGNCAGLSEKKYQTQQIIEKSITVYHGTSKDASQKIMSSGFIPSKSGRLGAGVYFTIQRKFAKQIAIWRGKLRKTDPFILKCLILQTEQSGFHGPWKNCTSEGFTEYVVKDPSRIRILNVQKALQQ